MAVLVILDANPNEPEGWRFLKADEYDGIQKHERNGWYTLIVGEDDE
ncbi:hypothetical protein [Pseudomonas aeruginosa]|nr:hypothetical protein [Pseudomonas aeruginosa]